MCTFMNNLGVTSDRDLVFRWQPGLGYKMSIHMANYTPLCIILKQNRTI